MFQIASDRNLPLKNIKIEHIFFSWLLLTLIKIELTCFASPTWTWSFCFSSYMFLKREITSSFSFCSFRGLNFCDWKHHKHRNYTVSKYLLFSFVTVIKQQCRNTFSLLMLLLQSTRGHRCPRQSTNTATKTPDLASYITEFTPKTEDNCTDIKLPQANKGFKNIFAHFVLI